MNACLISKTASLDLARDGEVCWCPRVCAVTLVSSSASCIDCFSAVNQELALKPYTFSDPCGTKLYTSYAMRRSASRSTGSSRSRPLPRRNGHVANMLVNASPPSPFSELHGIPSPGCRDMRALSGSRTSAVCVLCYERAPSTSRCSAMCTIDQPLIISMPCVLANLLEFT